MVSCDLDGAEGCGGGEPGKNPVVIHSSFNYSVSAFTYSSIFGLVSDECIPYTCTYSIAFNSLLVYLLKSSNSVKSSWRRGHRFLPFNLYQLFGGLEEVLQHRRHPRVAFRRIRYHGRHLPKWFPPLPPLPRFSISSLIAEFAFMEFRSC